MKRAKLFKNGQSQAVRLPREFRFEGQEVFIKRIGDITVLIPVDNPWQPLQDSLSKFSEDFMESRKQPKAQKREEIF